ncbi:uncharacterized protein LOC142349660 [Convolutriloba macropyga]|uniref:uncharacterized protein LOC142349660 n=1 Tax=Convolutriloba macropyga TaxID=536237 RepID=UPI003F522DE8
MFNMMLKFAQLVVNFVIVQMICFFLILPSYYSAQATPSSATEGEWNFTSNNLDQVYYLSFVLPSYFEILGSQCNMFSRYFCVLGFGTHEEKNDRIPDPDDRDDFHELVSTTFLSLNWFSFKTEDLHSMGCCMYQVNTYLRLGRAYGYSPEEYYDKVAGLGTNLDRTDLVFIKAKWEPTACTNVISQLGFGFGPFSVLTGQSLNESFIFPPLGVSDEVVFFEGFELLDKLTFDWFLHNVICKDQPRFCGIDETLDLEERKRPRVIPRKPFPSRTRFPPSIGKTIINIRW